MSKVISGLLILVGLVHLLPISGAFGPERLSALYGIPFQDPNLVILMRHRAILFGLLGLFLIAAAFQPALQPSAFIAGIFSVTSFIWLSWSAGTYNAAIARVVWIDAVALACLLLAIGLYFIKPSKD